MAVSARFDDCSESGEHFVLSAPIETFVATTVDTVCEVLEAAENAAAHGAWVAGFVSYEAAPAFDPQYGVHHGHPNVPLAWFTAFSARTAVEPFSGDARSIASRVEHAMGQQRHHACIAHIKEAIAAGMTYQVNLTNTWHFSCDDPRECYRSLVLAQHGRYHALIDTGTLVIASASPELFFARSTDTITSRPMKGTAARGRTTSEDERARDLLRASTKELAENVIVVDMVRNDLGRIGVTGSVHVDALAEIEQLPTVFQLTSTVSARVGTETSLADTFRALFPAASITGAPRHATMELIAHTEAAARGIYCGAIGYLAPGAHESQFAVAIRTAVIDSTTGTGTYGTGGGITWSSEPDHEWAEQLLKGKILTAPQARPALFETMALIDGDLPAHLDAHLDRIEHSAAYYSIRFDRERAAHLIAKTCDTCVRPGRIRLELSPRGDLIATAHAAPPRGEPVRLALAMTRVDHRDARLFHKRTDRCIYDEARASVGDLAVDDVMLINERGELTETTIANLAVLLDDAWWTPALSCGLLAGIARQELLASGTLTERVITVDDLAHATGIATVSALRGWRSATLVETWHP